MLSWQFDGYVTQLAPLRAARLRDAATAAAYPHFTKEGARSWMASLNQTIHAAAQAAADVAGEVFTFNGKAMGVRALKRAVGQAFSDVIRVGRR